MKTTFVVNGRRAIGGLAALAVVGTMFVGQSSVALAKCNPGRSNNNVNGQVGWYNQLGSTVGGVGANIYDYSPWVNYPNVTAWTMVSRGGTTWAQVGWLEQPFNVRYTFDQWTHDGTYSENDFFGSAVGQTHRYTTLYGNIPGDFSFLYDGGLLDYESAQWVPIYGYIYGENHTAANQMAGAVNSHEVFSNSQIWYSGGWHAFSGYADVENAPYARSSVSSAYQDDIWDTACST